MKRNLVFGPFSVVFLIVVFSATLVTPAFAETTFIEHATVVGQTVIDIPGVTPENGVKITFARYDKTSDHGARDHIGIYLWTYLPLYGEYRYFMVAWYSDTAEGVNYSETLLRPMPTDIKQLKRWQLNVWGRGRRAMALWTVPLEVPEITWFGGAFTTPAITIPPGCLILKGYNGVKTGETAPYTTPSGFTISSEYTGYDAKGCFFCLGWRHFGPTTGITTVREQTFTATKP